MRITRLQVFADSGELALVREYEELSDKLAHAQDDSSQLMSQLPSCSGWRLVALGNWRRQNYPHRWGFKISTPVSVVYPAATASALFWQAHSRAGCVADG